MTSLKLSDSQYLGEEFSLHDMIARCMKDRCTVSCTSLIGNDTEGLLKKQIPQDPAVLHMPEERLSSKCQKIYSQSAERSTAKYLDSFQDVSEKLSNYETKCLISHVCGSFEEMTNQSEDDVNDKLMPLTFVAVPPLSVKNEPTEDYQNDVRCFDSNLKDPLGELSDTLNFISERNIQKKCTSQSELQVKSEPKDGDNDYGVHMTEDSFFSDIVTRSCHEFTSKESNPSDKLNKDDLKTCIPNVCVSFMKMTKQCEEKVNNELMPLTFVAVPLLSVKNEQLEEYQNDAKCFDTNLKDPLGECSGESNLMSGRNIKKGCSFQSELQVKSEPKEDNNFYGVQMEKEKVAHLCHELTMKESNPFVSCHEKRSMENNSSVMFGDSFYSEDYVAGETLNLEVKYESVCKISGVHLKLEKFETNQCLNDGVCDDIETPTFKPESSAQHFPDSGCQQNVNEEECDASTSKITTLLILEIGNKTPDMRESRASSSVQSIYCRESKQIKKRTKESDSCCQNDKMITSKNEIGFLPVVHVDPLHLQLIPQFQLRNEPEGIVHSHPFKIMNFSCNFCPKSFKKMSNIRRHVLTHARVRPFECEACNKSFSLQKCMNKHLGTLTGNRPFAYEKTFSSIAVLKVDMRIHTDKPYKCEICKKSFYKKDFLKVHMRSHTGENPNECEICKKSLSHNRYLNDHMQHTGGRPYACEICKKSFRTNGQLINHKQTHSDARPFECEICEKSFRTNGQLIYHKQTHSDARPFECEICEKSFRTNGHLINHKQTHSDARPFECEICVKSFRTNGQLIYHKQTHSDARPYECEICEKSYRTKGQLNNHKQTHSNARPFECEICKKSFRTNGQLINHKQTHSGARPFECEICEKSFRRKEQLINHKQTHSGARSFECEICKKSFSVKNSLRRHIGTHTKE